MNRLTTGTAARRVASRHVLAAATGLALSTIALTETTGIQRKKPNKKMRKPAVCCRPKCDAKNCGSDRCGGSCGSCGSGQVCSNAAKGGRCRCTTPATCLSGWPDSDETNLLLQINQRRVMLGLRSLTMNNQLGEAAKLHSLDRATKGYAGHTSFDGASLAQRIAATGYAAAESAEIIYWCSGSGSGGNVGDVFNTWFGSAIDRETLQNPRFTDVGIGRAPDSNDSWHWTAVFAQPRE